MQSQVFIPRLAIRTCWLAALAIALADVAPSHAQGFVAHFEPPAVERGKTTRVAVVGTGLGKAVGLWTSVPGITATPAGESSKSRAEFDVTVANDAPVGVCGVRLAAVDGLANATFLLVDDLPLKPATKEPHTKLPAAIWGRFREAHVDRFTIDVAAGQAVSFEAVANRLGKDVDPLLTIRDADGRFILERDNDPGLYYDFRFEHTFARAGEYTIELRDARHFGNDAGYYIFRMGRFPADRVALPSTVRTGEKLQLRLPSGKSPEAIVAPQVHGLFSAQIRRPSDEGSSWIPLEAWSDSADIHQAHDSLESATLAKIPGRVSGILAKPGERHLFCMNLAKGQKIVVRAESKAFNSPADLEIAVLDSKGKEVRRAVENQKEEVTLDFTAGNPGIYGLAVRDIHRDGGPAFAYRLDISGGGPRIELNAEVEGLTVPKGSYQTLPIMVSRTDAAGPIKLALLGSSDGLTLEPSEIPDGANSVVCRLIASPDAPLGLQTVRISARLANQSDETYVHTRPLIDKQIYNVDLIPYGLREDQRRLPPSLADRFAVQITPPTPFTVELPESLVTLGRYQKVEFPITTTRMTGFDGPITFQVKGGQLGPKEEGRTRVYAEIPPATLKIAAATGAIYSLILTDIRKHRVDLTATGTHGGRQVSLTRTFDLDVRPAFSLSVDPPLAKLEPGGEAKFRITADRIKGFSGDIAVQLSNVPGIDGPERLTIAGKQSVAEVTLKVDATRSPGRVSVNLNATATVNGYEEEGRNPRLELEVVKTPATK